MGEQGWSRAREREGIRFSHDMYVQHCSPQRKNTEEEEEEVEKKKTTGTPWPPGGDTVPLQLPFLLFPVPIFDV